MNFNSNIGWFNYISWKTYHFGLLFCNFNAYIKINSYLGRLYNKHVKHINILHHATGRDPGTVSSSGCVPQEVRYDPNHSKDLNPTLTRVNLRQGHEFFVLGNGLLDNLIKLLFAERIQVTPFHKLTQQFYNLTLNLWSILTSSFSPKIKDEIVSKGSIFPQFDVIFHDKCIIGTPFLTIVPYDKQTYKNLAALHLTDI